MRAASCEDLLEWFYEYHIVNHDWPRWPLSTEQFEEIGLTRHTIRHCIRFLIRSGFIVHPLHVSDSHCVLTKEGISAGRKIHQKHKVLSCFFTEVLGMKPDDASSQACVLEHNASDDTIQRLDTYLSKNLGKTYLSFEMSNKQKRRLDDKYDDASTFFLSEGKIGEQYQIIAIKGCNRLERLTDLGLVPGACLRITQRLARSLVVTVKSCDIAISPEIAASILVVPWKNNV